MKFALLLKMRVKALSFLAATAAAETTSVNSDSIKGVITLLEGLLKNSEKEAKTTAEVYDKTACSCRDNLRSMAREFEETQKEIDRQTTISKDLKAKSDLLSFKIQKHIGVKSEMEAAVANKYVEIKVATASDQKTVNFAEETDAALTEEISEIGTINQPYLQGLIDVDTQSLSMERAKCTERLRKAEDMIDACDKVLKVLDGGQSKQIISMVKTLKDHAFQRKSAIQQGDNECQSKIYDLEKSISSSSNFLDLSKGNSAKIETEKADIDVQLGKASEAIAELAGARDQLKTDIGSTNVECQDAAKDYDAHSNLVKEEIAGLTGAIASLQKVPGPEAPEFVQLSSMNTDLMSKVDASINSIAQHATMLHSHRLATLALQMQFKNSATPDFFASVRSMIATMVSRLEGEQTAETSKTNWCAGTLAELKSAKRDSQVDLETASSSVRTSQEIIAEKTSEKKAKNEEKSEAEQVLAEMKELAAQKDKMYSEQEAEKTAGDQALGEAIGFLENIYKGEGATSRAAGPSGGVKTRATNGSGIIAMLTGIREDYIWDADVANMEMQCNDGDTYKPRGASEAVGCLNGVARKGEPTSPPTPVRSSELSELQKSIGTKKLEIIELNGEIDLLKGAISEEKVTVSDAKKSRTEKSGLLQSAKSALKARQEACVNANDSFESRQKRRNEEVAALKDALSILETHSQNSELGAGGVSFLAKLQ